MRSRAVFSVRNRSVQRVLTAAVAATGIAFTVPAVAEAAPAGACWAAGFYKTDPAGRPHEAFYCENESPTKVYSSAGYSGSYGTMYGTPSWYACKTENQFNGGGPHPYRWLYTQADSPSGWWGFVPDNHIISETDTVPNCIW
ncbi:hypothetical protein [Amycolatopsis plumensis]|uniref:Secreted protein n=1 Tax=Amycolatopsis plumensis TaxID=236508 RepID=A0ABV5U5Z8_9PSEU